MDPHLMGLRQRTLDASFNFLKARRAYLDAARPGRRTPEAELKRLAEAVRAAIDPYGLALRELLDRLRVAAPSKARDEGITLTENSLFTLGKEQLAFDDLIALHAKRMAK